MIILAIQHLNIDLKLGDGLFMF